MRMGGWTPDSLEALANYAQLLGLVGIVVAAWALIHSWTQIKQAARAARGEFILALDDALAQHIDIRNKVNTAGLDGLSDPKERNEVRRYLAVFERMGILVQDGLLTIETVNQLYGDRFAKLLSHDGVRKLVDGREYEPNERSDPEAWRDLIWLARELDRVREHPENKQLLPDAPTLERRSDDEPAPDVDKDLEPERELAAVTGRPPLPRSRPRT